LFAKHTLMGAHIVPVPEYPVLHVQVFVPGPVLAHVACESHPPMPAVQLSMGAQVVPLPA
jgi:hypothetical protein